MKTFSLFLNSSSSSFCCCCWMNTTEQNPRIPINFLIISFSKFVLLWWIRIQFVNLPLSFFSHFLVALWLHSSTYKIRRVKHKNQIKILHDELECKNFHNLLSASSSLWKRLNFITFNRNIDFIMRWDKMNKVLKIICLNVEWKREKSRIDWILYRLLQLRAKFRAYGKVRDQVK